LVRLLGELPDVRLNVPLYVVKAHFASFWIVCPLIPVIEAHQEKRDAHLERLGVIIFLLFLEKVLLALYL